jgi:hypothetical protein
MEQNLQKELSIFCNDDLLEPDKSPFDWWKKTVQNTQMFQNWLKLILAYQPHLCQVRGYLVRQD